MRLVLGSRILLPFLWGSGDGKRGRGNDDSGGLGGTLWSFPLVLGCCLIVPGKKPCWDCHASSVPKSLFPPELCHVAEILRPPDE